MKVHEALARAISRLDVGTVFGLVGDGNLFVVGSLVNDATVRYVGSAHEATAVAMADASARTRGGLGVATVTHGPGLTNTVTALTEAVKNRTPLLMLCGDTRVGDRATGQDVDQRAFVQATGAGFEQIAGPTTVISDLEIAIRRAVFERRPIVLNLPVNLQEVDVDEATAQASGLVALPIRPEVAPTFHAMDAAMGVVASASRPLILAGVGAVDARQELVALGRLIGAPLATTVKAKGLFRGEGSDLGIFGSLSSERTTAVIADADCILTFGASLTRWTTLDGDLIRGRPVVQCDVEPAAFRLDIPTLIPVAGSARAVAEQMSAMWVQAELPERGAPPALGPDAVPKTFRDDGLVLADALRTLNDLLPRERAVVVDTGRFMPAAMRELQVSHPRDFIFASNFGSVGLGVAAAVGAAIARPHRPAVAVVGDGGFMMGGFEAFNTAVRHDADLIVVVCNDGSYGAEYMTLAERQMDVGISLFSWPSFAGVATALGGHGVQVRSLNDLPAVTDLIARRDRPVVVELVLDPAQVPPVLGRPRRTDD